MIDATVFSIITIYQDDYLKRKHIAKCFVFPNHISKGNGVAKGLCGMQGNWFRSIGNEDDDIIKTHR